jgi:hypothetical protein
MPMIRRAVGKIQEYTEATGKVVKSTTAAVEPVEEELVEEVKTSTESEDEE